MRKRFIRQVTLMTFLLCHSTICPATETPDPSDPNRYLDAVRTFADNVLKYGRDTYGPKHTPLFVDGLNIHTHEPVKWISPKGGDPFTATETEEWILSNFASQQTLLRTLDGLSTLTGDAKYHEAAKEAIKYAFENLTAPNGLFYWGHYVAYDALKDEVKYASSKSHILKVHYPYYDRMWQVNPTATERFIDAFWSAHVIDWSNLDFNRIAPYSDSLEKPWEHEYSEHPIFFQGKRGGGGFFNTGTSLAYAAATLSHLSKQELPLVWSKRLIKRFVDTRHPATGMIKYMYNLLPFKVWRDDASDHFSDPRSFIFPSSVFAEMRNQYQPEDVWPHQWLSVLLVGDMLGEQGDDFVRWAKEELSAWGKASYRAKDNLFVPIITDGTNIEGYVLKEDCSIGNKGNVAVPLFADLSFFWAYATAYRITGDEFMWQMARDICSGNKLVDIGSSSGKNGDLAIDTTCSDVYALLGFLELYARTKQPALLCVARRVADNIIQDKFYKGFFVPSKIHIYTRFDSFEPLALLHLVAAIESQPESVPPVWPSSPLFVPSYRFRRAGVDRLIIYTQTDSPEVPMSLQEAAASGNIELVKSLIQRGIDVDSFDNDFRDTALHRAAIMGHTEIAKLLLEKGAFIDAKDSWPSETPLHYAAKYGRSGIIELLAERGADLNIKNEDGKTPLDLAISRNRPAIAKLLIEKGATIFNIHTAAFAGDLEKVRSFIEKGVDINEKDENGMTALHIAAQNKHKDIVASLLSKGADVDVRDNKGYTPLYKAVWNNNANMVELLVHNGADVNYTPQKDYPPLHYAVWYWNRNIARILLDHGADCDVKDQDGWTAFRYAVNSANKKIVDLFIKKGADLTGIHRAACVGDLIRIKSFLEDGTDVDVEDDMGWTPLYWAASMGQEAVGEFLLRKGAQAGIKTKGQRTPLHQAASSGTFRLAELLISKGADVKAQDKRKETPLHHAAANGHKEVVELLLTRGADVTAKDRRGRTADDWAKLRGHTEIVKLLREHQAKE